MTLKGKDAEEDAKENEYKYHKCKKDLGKDINEEVLPRFRQFYLTVAEKEWGDEKRDGRTTCQQRLSSQSKRSV